MNGWECEQVPWNVFLIKKLGLKRFYASTKLTVHEHATIKNIDLIDIG